MPTNQELRTKLKAKLAARKAIRGGKQAAKKYLDSTRQHNLRVNNNDDIFNCTEALMRDVSFLNTKGLKEMVPIDKVVGTKFIWLKKNYFALYRSALAGEMDLDMLKMMLTQKTRIDDKLIDAKKASLQVGDMLAKKYNVDIDALVKSAQANKDSGMKPNKQ